MLRVRILSQMVSRGHRLMEAQNLSQKEPRTDRRYTFATKPQLEKMLRKPLVLPNILPFRDHRNFEVRHPWVPTLVLPLQVDYLTS